MGSEGTIYDTEIYTRVSINRPTNIGYINIQLTLCSFKSNSFKIYLCLCPLMIKFDTATWPFKITTRSMEPNDMRIKLDM